MRVRGEGPIPCDLMLVGEGPGFHESQYGKPFVEHAPAGGELTRYCNGSILPFRYEIYITNLIKEWASGQPTKGTTIPDAEWQKDEWELQAEIAAVQPRLIVALGGVATRWFLGKPVDMEAVHGLLFKLPYTDFPHHCYLLPCYHPAAGLHQPEMAARTAYDLARASEILKLPPWDWDSRCWKPVGPMGYWWMPDAWQDLTGEYLPVNLPDEVGYDTEGTPEQPEFFQVAPKIGEAVICEVGKAGDWRRQWLASAISKGKNFVMQAAMWEFQVAESLGIKFDEDRFDDIQVMAYLLGVEPQGLKALAMRHLGKERLEFTDICGHYEQVIGKTGKPLKKQKLVINTMTDALNNPVTEGAAMMYMGQDASDPLALKQALWPRIVDQGLESIYHIDRRALPVYARMESVGMPVNLDHYTEFSKWLEQRIDEKTADLQAEYPNLNPASSKQVSQVMFGHLGLPSHKKTPKGQDSTNDKILQALKDHPFVAAIIEWRELTKLKNTFVDQMPSFCRWHHYPVNAYSASGPSGGYRLHYRLLPTRVVSGRLAAKDPNVLAFPKHSELGKRFRAGVQASPGCLLGSWDLDQIELRVLALDSGSPTLIEIFKNGIDLHARTGYKIFGVPPELQDDSLHRLPSKTTNFSVIMGTTGIGLAEQQRKNGYPFPELKGVFFKSIKDRHMAQAEVCQQWVNTVISEWGIDSYIKGKHAEARRHGYVTDLWGRRRYLPSVLSPNQQIREEALRQAQAFGPQAGARGFYKQMLVRAWREVILPMQAEGYYIEPILDLHDDFMYEAQGEIAEVAHLMIGCIFNGTFDSLDVPISSKGDLKERWSDLKGKKLAA